MNEVVLLAGPSGTGKTSLLEKMTGLDSNFEHIFTYMTRPKRENEKERETKSLKELEEMYHNGEVLYLLKRHGVMFGPSTTSLYKILNHGNIPVIEMSVYELDTFQKKYPKTIVAYVAPQSLEILMGHLLRDGRSTGSDRQSESAKELDDYKSNKLNCFIDIHLVNQEHRIAETAGSAILKIKALIKPAATIKLC